MALRINDTAPDFEADTTDGKIKFHDWIGDGWAVMFSHPKDFTPVCTTELGYMAGLMDEFDKRNCKIIGISVDPVESHQKWKKDIASATGQTVSYPMIGDPELKIAKLYDMLGAEAGNSFEGRTAVDNQTVRTVFLVGPDKKIKMQLSYPMTTGRNFEELLRVIDFGSADVHSQGGDTGRMEERRRCDRGTGGLRRPSARPARRFRGQAAVSPGRFSAGLISAITQRISGINLWC